MNMRTVLNPSGSNTALVDKRIGNAYPAVAAVYTKLAEIEYLAHNLDNLRPREVEFRSNDVDKVIEWRYAEPDAEWQTMVTYASIAGADIPTLTALLQVTRQEVSLKAAQVEANRVIVDQKTTQTVNAAAAALASQNAAAGSATAAAGSATTAAARAVDATNASDTATASKNAAAASQLAAGNSATSAQGSATTATTQAGISTTKAGEAATSASTAAGSASTATNAASTATTKAAEAVTSANNSATARDASVAAKNLAESAAAAHPFLFIGG